MKKLIFLLLLLPAIVQAQTGIVQGREFRYNPKTSVTYRNYPGDSSIVMIDRTTGKFFRTHITGGGGGGGYNPGDSIAYLYSIVYPKENLGSGIPQTYPRGDSVELQRTMDNGSGIEADTLPTGEQIFHLNGSLTKDATLNGANTYKFKLENTHFWQTGTHGSGPTIPEYFESQFFFNNRKSAFRAGRAAGSQFSEAAVGNFSTAFGANTEARGDYTVAAGLNTRAMGAGSVSLGVDGAAYGNTAITIGNNNNSYHNYSITIGRNSSARGVSGLAAGFALKQKGFGGTVFGVWNDSTDAASNTEYNAANRIFQVGNGQGDSLRSNAMTILSDGRTGFGTTTPHSSALVQLSSTTRGFLFPRMTATQMNAISSPDTSLVVFNTTSGLFFYYTGAAWDTIGASSSSAGTTDDGTYTPTLTNITNISSSTAILCHFTLVGSQVHVQGSVTLTATGSGAFQLNISLPSAYATTFSASTDLTGVGNKKHTTADAVFNCYFEADTTNEVAALKGAAAGAGTATFFFSFMYTYTPL